MEIRSTLLKIFESSASLLLHSAALEKGNVSIAENYIEKISSLADESHAFDCNITYSLSDDVKHTVGCATVWSRFCTYIQLMVSPVGGEKRKVVLENLQPLCISGRESFSYVLFQFLLSRSFASLQLNSTHELTALTEDISGASKSTEPEEEEASEYIEVTEYTDDDRVTHTVDRSVTVYDFEPVVGMHSYVSQNLMFSLTPKISCSLMFKVI